MSTPSGAATTWRARTCPWAPERKRCRPEAGGTPLSARAGLVTPMNYWPAPSSCDSNDSSRSPCSQSSVQTPMDAAATTWRTMVCPGAPYKRGDDSFLASGLSTPGRFRPGALVGAWESRSVPIRGPLVRMLTSASSPDITPAAGGRQRIFSDVGPFDTARCRAFSDATPIAATRPRTFSDGTSLTMRRADLWGPYPSSLDGTPVAGEFGSTEMRYGVEPTNAFGMWTVQEGGNSGSAVGSNVAIAAVCGEEKPEQGEDGWMPPAEALAGGA